MILIKNMENQTSILISVVSVMKITVVGFIAINLCMMNYFQINLIGWILMLN